MSGNPTIIDTQAVLKKVHDMYAMADLLEDEAEQQQLRSIANSAFSAVLIYMRHSTAVVQRKHYDSIKDSTMYYRYLAKNCGVWPVARAMRKAGYSMWQCRWALLSKEEYPVLRKVIYFGRREGR